MGNIHPPPENSTNGCARAATRAVRQVCPLTAFILGGPMPPSPGLIPLCWEDLVDWTNDATEITEQVYQRSKNEKSMLPSAIHRLRGIHFVPYVSVHETDAALKRLASQSYMERAQFYQESVIIAVTSKQEDQGVLCLISLFQFCRYFTLIRRLAESQTLVMEYQSGPLPNEGESYLFSDEGLDTSEEKDSLLISSPPQQQVAPPSEEGKLQDCVICLEQTEDSVLVCCSQAICADCERRWVRKRLRCPFCRQSFASLKEATQTQWQLSSAIPVEQVVQDVHFLGQKVESFWESLGIDHNKSGLELEAILAENYVPRPKTLQSLEEFEGDGFILVEELAGFGCLYQDDTTL